MIALHRLPTLLAAVFAVTTLPLISAEDSKDSKVEEKKEAPKPYKLTTCIVTDEKLDEMGEPFVFSHEGREIKMCCKKCKLKFDKDPATYLKKIEGK
jgi:YHS domain-containing protein